MSRMGRGGTHGRPRGSPGTLCGADLSASFSGSNGTAPGVRAGAIPEGRAGAGRHRGRAVLRESAPVPAGAGGVRVPPYRRESGCATHTSTDGEGVTLHRRGWERGDPGTPVPSGMGLPRRGGAVGPHVFPPLLVPGAPGGVAGRGRGGEQPFSSPITLLPCRARFTSPIAGRGRGWAPSGAKTQRRAGGALCWCRRAPAAARPRRGGSCAVTQGSSSGSPQLPAPAPRGAWGLLQAAKGRRAAPRIVAAPEDMVG